MIIILSVTIFFVQKQPKSSDPPPEDNKSNEEELYWGVDSASYTDEDLYMCVQEEFEKPSVWGRYLGDIEGVSVGLDADEVAYLHDQGVDILIIYNHFSDATGYDHGVEEAEQAISFAESLDTPEGVALFGDIEPKYPVNTEFIEGWYDAFSESIYEPGLYGVFNEDGDTFAAYEGANEEVQENTIVWTAYPQEGITTKSDAPSFAGEGPSNAMLYGWQYGQGAEECNIDTNIFIDNMIDYLWTAD